jgi:hypothetical protein
VKLVEGTKFEHGFWVLVQRIEALGIAAAVAADDVVVAVVEWRRAGKHIAGKLGHWQEEVQIYARGHAKAQTV